MDPLSTSPQSISPPPKQSRLSPILQSVLPKQSRNQHCLTPDSLLYTSKLRSRDQPILRQPRKTKPIVWLAAILCMLFIVMVIVLGIATLIVFLTVQPRIPSFDTPSATINTVYFNPPQFINGEITLLANISNPNRRLSVRFEHLHVELYFSESLIATQVLVPFSERPGETRLVSVHLVWGSVFLPPNLVGEILGQAQRNRVVYNLKGAFRVRVKTGLIQYSYWMHLECQLEMTSPPNSALVTHSCTTKK